MNREEERRIKCNVSLNITQSANRLLGNEYKVCLGRKSVSLRFVAALSGQYQPL